MIPATQSFLGARPVTSNITMNVSSHGGDVLPGFSGLTPISGRGSLAKPETVAKTPQSIAHANTFKAQASQNTRVNPTTLDKPNKESVQQHQTPLAQKLNPQNTPQ